MIELIIRGIFENSEKIDNMTRCLNKFKKKHVAQIILLAASSYLLNKRINKQEEKIIDLETELEGMRSILEKGE